MFPFSLGGRGKKKREDLEGEEEEGDYHINDLLGRTSLSSREGEGREEYMERGKRKWAQRRTIENLHLLSPSETEEEKRAGARRYGPPLAVPLRGGGKRMGRGGGAALSGVPIILRK